MANDLLDPAELAHLSGAPFTDQEVDEAVAALRGELGWHVAPVRSETLLLDVICGDPVLRLPTRALVSVDEIRNARTATVIDATGYTVSITFARVRRGSWPSGYGAVEVDLTHGFASCPPEIRPIIAQRILRSRGGGAAVEESIDDYTIKYAVTAGESVNAEDVLARYNLRYGVA